LSAQTPERPIITIPLPAGSSRASLDLPAARTGNGGTRHSTQAIAAPAVAAFAVYATAAPALADQSGTGSKQCTQDSKGH